MFINYFQEVWHILMALAPWLFFGAFLAGLLKLFIPENFVAKHMGHNSFMSIIKTSLLGVPLPLCSCGVLPTTIGLKKSGANNGAAMGFLISTPQTGVDSILVTASFLGWPLALFKVLAAFLTGLFGGMAQQFSDRYAKPTGKTEPNDSQQPKAKDDQNSDNCDDGSCHGSASTATISKARIFYNYSINELIGGIYGYMAIGILIAGLVAVLFPSQLLAEYPALQGPLGMLIMLILAIPLYICTTGSVPIAASLISAGLPVGSALVFLMAGPATNAATLAAVYKSFGKRFVAIYLTTVIIGSMAFGLIFQSWLGDSEMVKGLMNHHGEVTLWTWVEGISASVLILLMLNWFRTDLLGWSKRLFKKSKSKTLPTASFKVQGMTCKNCIANVTRAVEKLKGISEVSITLETGRVNVSGNALNNDAILKAIEKAGYQVAPWEVQ